jgi:hypothetical protein
VQSDRKVGIEISSESVLTLTFEMQDKGMFVICSSFYSLSIGDAHSSIMKTLCHNKGREVKSVILTQPPMLPVSSRPTTVPDPISALFCGFTP